MSNYWAKRFEKIEDETHKYSIEYFKQVDKAYTKAIEDIEKEISTWYMRFATENNISYSEALKILNTRDLKAFRMSVEEYIEKGQSLDPKFAKELEQVSVKVHVTRLEALKMQMQMQCDALHTVTLNAIDAMAVKTFTEHYYKTLYTIQNNCKVGFNVMKLNTKVINEAFNRSWAKDGKIFSDRLWENKNKLIAELDTTFTQNLIRGKNPKVIVEEVAKRLNVSKSNVCRLFMTENKMLQSKAQQKSFKELGVKQYKISATFDLKTSQICQEMHDHIFNMNEFAVGVTAPPFHPYCRTTTVPYDEDDKFFDFERGARDKDGKYITIPSSMTYNEWKEKFITSQ